jgi:alanyl-tRNA synthetase
LSDDKAFFLYDSLGFLIDLTEQIAEEAGSGDVVGTFLWCRFDQNSTYIILRY